MLQSRSQILTSHNGSWLSQQAHSVQHWQRMISVQSRFYNRQQCVKVKVLFYWTIKTVGHSYINYKMHVPKIMNTLYIHIQFFFLQFCRITETCIFCFNILWQLSRLTYCKVSYENQYFDILDNNNEKSRYITVMISVPVHYVSYKSLSPWFLEWHILYRQALFRN